MKEIDELDENVKLDNDNPANENNDEQNEYDDEIFDKEGNPLENDDIKQFNFETFAEKDEYTRIYNEFIERKKIDDDIERKEKEAEESQKLKILADNRRKRDEIRRAGKKKSRRSSNIDVDQSTTFADDDTENIINEINTDTEPKKVAINEKQADKANAEEFVKASMVLESGMKALVVELKRLREAFAKTQDDPKNNFVFNDKTNRVEKEGSTLYRTMTAKLKWCIERMENPKNSPEDLRDDLHELQKAAAKYYKERDKFLTGPLSPNGRKRRNAARTTVEHVSVILNCYDRMTSKLSDITDEKGVPYSEKSIAVVKNKALNLMVESPELFKTKALFEQGGLPDGKKPRDVFGETFRASRKHNDIVKKIGAIYPGLVKNYGHVNNPDELIVKSGINHDNPVEVAKLYVAKKMLDKVFDVNTGNNELEKLEAKVTSNFISREANNLLAKPSYAREFNALPLKSFSRCDNIKNVNKECLMIHKKYKELIDKTVKYHGTLGDSLVFECTGGFRADDSVFSRAMIASIMSSKEGEDVVAIYSGSKNKDAAYQGMTIAIERCMKGKWSFNERPDRETAVDDVNDLIENPSFRKAVIKAIKKMKDPESVAVRQQEKRLNSYNKKASEDEEKLKNDPEYKQSLIDKHERSMGL